MRCVRAMCAFRVEMPRSRNVMKRWIRPVGRQKLVPFARRIEIFANRRRHGKTDEGMVRVVVGRTALLGVDLVSEGNSSKLSRCLVK